VAERVLHAEDEGCEDSRLPHGKADQVDVMADHGETHARLERDQTASARVSHVELEITTSSPEEDDVERSPRLHRHSRQLQQVLLHLLLNRLEALPFEDPHDKQESQAVEGSVHERGREDLSRSRDQHRMQPERWMSHHACDLQQRKMRRSSRLDEPVPRMRHVPVEQAHGRPSRINTFLCPWPVIECIACHLAK